MTHPHYGPERSEQRYNPSYGQPSYGQLPSAPPPPPAAPEPKKRRTGLWVALGVVGLIIVIGLVSNSANSNRGTVTAAPVGPGTSQAAAPATTQSSVATFGQRYTFASGLAIEVATPATYQPSQNSIGHTRSRAIIVTTKVINTSNTPYGFNPLIVGPNATHGGAVAAQIFDSQELGGVIPMVTILPGESFEYKTAFSIGDAPAKLQLEYSDKLGYTPGIFTGQV